MSVAGFPGRLVRAGGLFLLALAISSCGARDPQQLAMKYFSAFQKGDFNAQYGMIHPDLRQVEPRDRFVAAQTRQASRHKLLSFEVVGKPSVYPNPWRAFLKLTWSGTGAKPEVAWRGLTMKRRGSGWYVMDTPAAREEASDAYRAAEYTRATILLQAILRNNPTDAESMDMLGYVYRDNSALRNNLEMAIDVHRQAIELEPRNPDWHHSLGNDYRLLGWYQGAVDEIKSAIEIDPKAIYYVWLGVAYGTSQRVDPARAAWREALRIDPGMAQASAFLEKIR
jgi:tetratricopeptide (TPR) repeat protein